MPGKTTANNLHGHENKHELLLDDLGGFHFNVKTDSLLEAFSSDMARQQAVVSAAYRLARVDRAAADRLIKKYVSDPTLRSQVERNLASMIP